MPPPRSASAVVFEMKPAAIYARFSTELQNEKSTEDQIALCQRYAARHQWIRCSAVRESGSCSNRRIIYLRDIEGLVLSGMAEELKDPKIMKTYVRSYNSERERLAGNASAVRTRLEAKRDRIESERQRNIDLVIKYVISEDDAKQRIADLKEERLRVEAELAALEEAPVLCLP